MSPVKRIILTVVPGLLFGAVFVYDIIRATVDLEVTGFNYAREAAIVLAFLMLFFLLEDGQPRRMRGAPKDIGRLLLFNLGALVVVGLVSVFAGAPDGNGMISSVRWSVVESVGSFVSGTALAVAAMLSLMTIRELVFYKRKRETKRNFLIFLTLLFAACAASLPVLSLEGSLMASLFFPVAVVAIVVNSFKQSWIVFLSRREKLYAIAYSVLLFLTLVVLTVLLTQSSDATRAVKALSAPLHTFIRLVGIFGAVYFGMAFVSTLFHLPTAEVFERKQSELTSLHNLSRLVTQVFDFNDLVNTVTQMTTEVVGAQRAWLELIQPNPAPGGAPVEIVAHRNLDADTVQRLSWGASSGIRDLMLRSRKVLLVDDLESDKRVEALRGVGLERGSLLSVPLTTHDELIGILHATKEYQHGFDQDDIDVMTAFADQVSIALENSRLIRRSLERERLQQELLVAQRMQKRLLPQSLPRLASVDIAAISESSLEVGGDYYDVVTLDDNTLGIVVGDVSGKGVSAAFYMAEMKGIFLSLSRLCTSPRDLLVRANTTLMESLEKNAFISLVYVMLDHRRGRIVLARAGHCPVVYLSGGTAELVRPSGLGLGLTDGPLFDRSTEERTLDLSRGDVCILYTDGVTETRSADGEEYGNDRLVAAALRAREHSAEEIRRSILRDVQTFSSSPSYTDDMTLVVIKWLGQPLGKE